MLMKTVVLVVVAVVAPSVVPVVQGKTKSCIELAEKKCKKVEQCTFLSSSKECYLTVGKDSVVRQGNKNVAPGPLCTVGGGQNNVAGYTDPAESYNVIGGGVDNTCWGNKNTISGGKSNLVDESEDSKYNTISGGWSNHINDSTASVITGGGGVFDEFNDDQNIIEGDTSTLSGGSRNSIYGSGHTVTGGLGNTVGDSSDMPSVVIGGTSNMATQGSAVIMGGQSNKAFGKNSIAFGQNAMPSYDHSMVVNLMEPKSDKSFLDATQNGHFLVNANSFRFQVGNGDSATINSENINRLKKELLE